MNCILLIVANRFQHVQHMARFQHNHSNISIQQVARLFEELESERADADELQHTLDEEERVLRTENSIVDNYSRV